MARPSEAHLEVAHQLLAQSGTLPGNAEDTAAAATRLYETLFRALAPVIGANGFRALFARSVKVTRADHPGLDSATTGERVVESVAACLGSLPPAAASTIAAALYANLFGLLTNFIGDSLVRQLVKRAFPGIDEAASKETE